MGAQTFSQSAINSGPNDWGDGIFCQSDINGKFLIKVEGSGNHSKCQNVQN